MTVHVQLGDSLEVLRRLPADSIAAVVTDPPYGLGKPPDMVEVLTAWLAGVPYVPKGKGFMGKEWDAFVPGPELWREVFRVMRPGAHAAVFAGTRTQDVMGLALRLAGFEVRDSVAWLYGSGFPKSLDVAKAVAEFHGEATASTYTPDHKNEVFGAGCGGGHVPAGSRSRTCAGPQGQAWAGWGTALKPGHEPILIVRKPFPGTVASNVVAHGTGGINVDAGRIGYASEADQAKLSAGVEAIRERGGVMDGSWKNSSDLAGANPASTLGRWPANVALDEATAAELGESARYFYCPKASRSEREAGLEDFPEVRRTDGREHEHETPCLRTSSRKCTHPTVKPVALMQWLLRLIVPPGGVALDPFGGSGTTGIAAVREGFDALLIEREAPYVEIAKARIAHAMERIER